MTQPGPPKNHVQTMFGSIARRYDILNHLLSLGLDFYWWREMARAAGAKPGVRILDVAAGTGDSTLALAKRGADVVASDFTIPMLALGPEKFNKSGVADSVIGSVGADAQQLPFRDSSFDALTICYGVRNVENREKAYAEFNRVLKPGGRLVILEFSRPRRGWLRSFYSAYSRYLLPRLGGWISGDKNAYTYLPESIKRFPPQTDLALELKNAGFTDVTWRDLCLGVVAIHVGIRGNQRECPQSPTAPMSC
ncbi:MAG: bifunctional demethylmenaquinone methyltransferase/2-methoxy-6-polyprenyl-1,4-benzoquinol methylase UbiE [Holophagales bacterium]|nr:bifunctional demethylmenaquinone methyltransferase/2-methoxy-6-polyprenyl-1,4-benzoquinol methylase UbiE [Holophagales bacterium]